MVSASWKNEPLGSVATLQRGFDLPSRLRRPGAVPIVTSSGIEDRHCEAKVKGPGVVTGRYGTIGEVFFVPDDFWPLNTTLYVRDFHGNDPLFISYLLRTIDFHTHSGKSGVPGVNRNDLHEIAVPFPPTKTEQEAIAGALSDADALIESLEQLVAKKRQLKQGAMQELLTGKKRLPGFSREWDEKRLGEVAEMGSGGTPSSTNPAFYDGDIPWVSIADMTKCGKFISTTDRNLSTSGLNNSAAQMFPAGTVLYAMYASLGECSIARVPLCSSQAILGIRAKPILDNEFLYYFLILIRPEVKTLGQQGTQANLNKGMVQGFQLRLPHRPEQSAIATVFSDMDAEIAALKAKLAKARDLKQGMMQELLTGRIRLV
jgi:type I restriction enzyme, S subunit